MPLLHLRQLCCCPPMYRVVLSHLGSEVLAQGLGTCTSSTSRPQGFFMLWGGWLVLWGPSLLLWFASRDGFKRLLSCVQLHMQSYAHSHIQLGKHRATYRHRKPHIYRATYKATYRATHGYSGPAIHSCIRASAHRALLPWDTPPPVRACDLEMLLMLQGKNRG